MTEEERMEHRRLDAGHAFEMNLPAVSRAQFYRE
jgi:hypothetical protein